MGIRKRGDAWQIVIDVGKPIKTEDGKLKRQQKVFTFRGTKAEARAEEARLKALYKYQTSVKNMTLKQYMLYWLETYKKHKLAVRTYESYKETIEVHIGRDEIGKKPFDRVTPDDIQEYYNRKLAEGLSGTSVLYHHRILHAAYQQAVKARMLPWMMNPCDAVEPPEKDDFKPAELTPAEVYELIVATAGKPIQMHIVISAMTGARAGEVCGLQWPDVDFERMVIRINKAVKREGGKLVLGSTKNKKERYVPMTPGLAAVLLKHKKEQDRIKEIYGPGYKDQGFVVAWEDGRWFDPHYLSTSFTKILRLINFPKKVTFHTLRHFYASAMQKAGANLKYISDALGHGKMDNITADVYIHTQVEDMRKYVNWLDDAVLVPAFPWLKDKITKVTN